MHKLNATAMRDRKCVKCRGLIPAGSRYIIIQDRTASPFHAGTLYPSRRWCAKCAGLSKAEPTKGAMNGTH